MGIHIVYALVREGPDGHEYAYGPSEAELDQRLVIESRTGSVRSDDVRDAGRVAGRIQNEVRRQGRWPAAGAIQS